jgi:excisionase family DNA binding protein
MKQENKLIYSVIEMAELLGIGRSKAYELVRSGTIPSLRLGRRIIIPKLALSRFLAECAHQNDDEADHQSRKSVTGQPW